MSDLSGIKIQKGKIGTNTISNEDGISGLVFIDKGVDDLMLWTDEAIFKCYSEEDISNHIDHIEPNKLSNAFKRQVSEFYRIAGSGTPLYVVFAKTIKGVERMLLTAKGSICQVAVFSAIEDDGNFYFIDGLAGITLSTIREMQKLAVWAYDNFMPIQVVIQGYISPNVDLSILPDLRLLPDGLEADKVSVMIGYDVGNKHSIDAADFAVCPDVGTVLGLMSKAKVNENIGNNELFNITDPLRKVWLEPGIVSGNSNTEVYGKLQVLENKGYLFGVTYPGLSGVRINNDHVCTPIKVDVDGNMNEHTISYGRVMDKAVRELRKVYLPKVKTDWNVDKKTGKLSKGTRVALENVGDDVFKDMVLRGEITYGKAYVDGDSDLLVEKILRTSYVIIPKGCIGEIRGTINLKIRM